MLNISHNQVERLTREALDRFPTLQFLNISHNKLSSFNITAKKVPGGPDGSGDSLGLDGANSSEPSVHSLRPDYSNGSFGLNVTRAPDNPYTTDGPSYPDDSQSQDVLDGIRKGRPFGRNSSTFTSKTRSRPKPSRLQSTLFPWLTTISPNGSDGSYPPDTNDTDWGDYGTFGRLRYLDLSHNELRTITGRVLNLSRLQHVWLAGNPFDCSCENVKLRDLMIHRTKRFQDYKEVKVQKLGHYQGRVHN